MLAQFALTVVAGWEGKGANFQSFVLR